MKKENCYHKFKWNYLPINGKTEYQEDWNQTLLTRINLVSANIYQKSIIDGANIIEINSKLMPLIKTLEYYNPLDNLIANKYKVIINDDAEDEIIYVYRIVYVIPTDIKIQEDGLFKYNIKSKDNYS